MKATNISVVIPAYNEAKSIESTVREIALYLDETGYKFEIIVVDDGSKDDTAALVKTLSADISQLTLISYGSNRGKGYAVRTGMLSATGDFALFTDADNATPITELPNLMKAIENGSDIAIASRGVAGSIRVVHQPFYREIGGKVLNFFIRLAAVPGIRDTQCGFKLFTKDAAQSIFPKCFIDDFSFDVEVLFLARKLGFEVAEIPVHWTHHGGSRVNPLRDGLRMLADICKIRFHGYRSKTI